MNRATKNVGLAAGIAVIIMWQLGYWLPAMMAEAPVGLEAAITAVVAAITARLSQDKGPPGSK